MSTITTTAVAFNEHRERVYRLLSSLNAALNEFEQDITGASAEVEVVSLDDRTHRIKAIYLKGRVGGDVQ